MPKRGQKSEVHHHFTVDVEEYFQVEALARVAPRARWDEYESRVVASTDRILDMLREHGARGTFFILGWIAERHPDLVRRVAAAGHEVASHGWGHRRVSTLTRDEFRESVRRAKAVLEEILGTEVIGYRAPSFSILRGGDWALEILAEEGYRYDSSLFPIRRPGYGWSGAPRDPYDIPLRAGRLREYPPATLRLGAARLPAAGGAYLRLLPLTLTLGAIRQAERRGVPATIYTHPWELDPGQPRFEVGLATRIRHYGGLGRTIRRLDALLSRFKFRPMAESFREDDPMTATDTATHV